MQRLSHILPRIAVLFAFLWLAGGCADNHLPETTTQGATTQGATTQGTTTQGTGTQGTTACTGSCTPYIYLTPFNIGLRPGVSFQFSAIANEVADPSVTWSVKEGPTGGIITDGASILHLLFKASTTLSPHPKAIPP